MEELCELANTGLNQGVLVMFTVAALFVSAALIKKLGLKNTGLLGLVVVMAIALQSISAVTAFAGSGTTCPENDSAQSPGTNTPVEDLDEPEVLGGLVNDSPELTAQFAPPFEDGDPPLFAGYSATFAVLDNDSEPDDDPFDTSTLQLIGDYPYTDQFGYDYFLFLDPEDTTIPDPDGLGLSASNVWGYWQAELTCDPEDTDHCSINPDLEAICTDPTGGTCWTSGNVIVYVSVNATPGEYTILYTVSTVGGANLIPATITITVPDSPPPPPDDDSPPPDGPDPGDT